MSKKINAAADELVKALKVHAEAVGGTRVSLKKSQRAAVKLQAAATAYASIVFAKTGLDSPFSDVVRPGLEYVTLESLEAERDKMVKHAKK